ncbi:MAG: hypothetical protein MJZ92_05110, partial [Paludibacteraceae bacterium]|nr:hypothetical protein [Paludibacteraceae bacterium]
MLKKHFFWPMLFVLLLFSSQGLQAAVGDKTTCDTKWTLTEFNNGTYGSIHDNIFEGKGNYTTFTISGSKNAHYETATGPLGGQVSTLTFSPTAQKETDTWKITWTEIGATVAVTKVKTHVHVYTGVAGYCKYFLFSLNGGKTDGIGTITPNYMDNGTASWTSFSTDIEPTQKEIPFSLNIQKPTIGNIDNGEMLFMRDLEIWYNVIPNAPTWNLLDNKDNMSVTINTDYWYEVANHVVVNDAFKGTVKYELDPEAASSKYVVWNSDHTKFKVLKEGTYRVRAYVDMVEGKYCSSAYSEYLEVTASIADSEKDQYRISFMVDGKLAEEKDPVNHFWDITIPVTEYGEHYIEYISAQSTPALEFPTRTQDYLTYQPEVVTDPFGDHFKIFGEEGTDTVVVKQGEKAVATLRINITRTGTNHVPFIINTKEQYDNKSLLTAINDCSWNGEKDHLDIEFAEKDLIDKGDMRSFEVTFTGVPDTMTFTYGSNATAIMAQSQLLVQAYDGTWKTLEQISGKTGGNNSDYKFALAPNVSQVKFDYWNVENVGWIKDLKITERKDIVLPDTILLWGRHKQGGTATQRYDIAWYNVHPDLTLTIANDTYSRFDKNFAGGNTVSLDKFGTLPVDLTYKLDSVGIFYADLMAKTGEVKNPVVKGCILKGVTGYAADELVLENSLPNDTVSGEVDVPIENPFQVVDTAGNIIQNDSLHIEYEILPADGAIINGDGNFVPKCVGYTQIVAKAEENLVFPAGLKDTLYIYLGEKEANTITWDSAKFDIGVGDNNINFSNFVHSADNDAVLTINEISDNKLLTRTSGNRFNAGATTGLVTLEAVAGKTCNHFEVKDTFTFML